MADDPQIPTTTAEERPPDASGAGDTPPTLPVAAPVPKVPVKKKPEVPKPTDAAQHPLARIVREKFGDGLIEASEFLGQLSLRIDPARIVAVCQFLRDHTETRFDYLCDLTCVHYPDREAAPFEMVYQLTALSSNTRVRLKAAVTEAGLDSLTAVWPGANWPEREVFDLFGIQFHGHPDLRRILLPPDWPGHPFRKEYPLEFKDNDWTARNLPAFSEIEKEQVEQRRAYGLEALSNLEEREMRTVLQLGKEVMPKDK